MISFVFVLGELTNQILYILFFSCLERDTMRKQFRTSFSEILVGWTNDQWQADRHWLNRVLPSAIGRDCLSEKGEIRNLDQLG